MGAQICPEKRDHHDLLNFENFRQAVLCLQCFAAVGWAAGGASGL